MEPPVTPLLFQAKLLFTLHGGWRGLVALGMLLAGLA
jgi:hypothetical protein